MLHWPCGQAPDGAEQSFVGRLSAVEMKELARFHQFTDTHLCACCRASEPRTRSQLLRHFGLELAFLFLSKNTEQDMRTSCGLDDQKVLKVGLMYSLADK